MALQRKKISKPRNGNLKWLTSYEKYLEANRVKVFNKKAYDLMSKDSSSEKAAVSALKSMGYIDKNGKVAAQYR